MAQIHAGFPTRIWIVHVENAQLGHIGRMRAQGYAHGSFPYVTSVDDDDWIEPDAFQCLRDALVLHRFPAVYTREWTWQNGKRSAYNGRQNLRIFRRGITESFDFQSWPALDSTALIAHADGFGPYLTLNERVYNYTVDPNSEARRLITRDVMTRGRALLHG